MYSDSYDNEAFVPDEVNYNVEIFQSKSEEQDGRGLRDTRGVEDSERNMAERIFRYNY